jgi:hypothetical protein
MDALALKCREGGRFGRSGLRSPYGAPHMASASAPITAWTNPDDLPERVGVDLLEVLAKPDHTVDRWFDHGLPPLSSPC